MAAERKKKETKNQHPDQEPRFGSLTPPDVMKPVIVGGVFLLAAVMLNGMFSLLTRETPSDTTNFPLPAATPYFEADMMETSALFGVDASKGWQTTKLYIPQGTTIDIQVSGGKWNNWKEYNKGEGSNYVCAQVMPPDKCVEPVPDFPSGALIARVGQQVFKVGASGIFTTEYSGFLEMRMNDADVGLRDNTGRLVVEVQLERP